MLIRWLRRATTKPGNERIETGVLVKSQKKWKKVSVDRKMVRMLSSGEATGQCSRDNKHNRPLLQQKRGHRLTEETPRKVLVPGEIVFR